MAASGSGWLSGQRNRFRPVPGTVRDHLAAERGRARRNGRPGRAEL